MKKICIIGASFLWTPTLVTDLLAKFQEEPLKIHFVDIVLEHALICKRWGEAASRAFGRENDCYLATLNRREGLQDADAVIITISTGGLDAMEQDVTIPEKYGIFATVGDTAGAGGWSRSIRNIPVFMDFARDIRECCPTAFVANYTNPMSTLTATLSSLCPNPVSGFCHAYFETKDVLQKIFGLEDWSRISLEIAGMNHFTWITGFKIDSQDGYPMLKERIGAGSLRDIIPKESADEIGIYSAHNLFVELYDQYGYLPYPADRHTSEFTSFALTGSPAFQKKLDSEGNLLDVLDFCGITRTPMEFRRKGAKAGRARILKATEEMELAPFGSKTPKKSRETGSDMIWGYLYNKPVSDAVNLINIGQIPGLPLGACVETIGFVDGYGVRPLTTGQIPEWLLELMRPQAVCTKWITEGMLSGDRNLVLQALYHDPQCAHLLPHQKKALGEELLAANQAFVQL